MFAANSLSKAMEEVQAAYIADGHDNVSFADTQYKASGELNEMLGAGSIFGVALPGSFEPIAFFVRAPGAFLVLAVLVAIMNAVGIKTAANKKTEGCDGCCATCASACEKKEADNK